MSKYLIFYLFHEFNRITYQRLLRLKEMNPQSQIEPCFGVKQTFYLPNIFDFSFLPFISGTALRDIVSWPLLQFKPVFKISKIINHRIRGSMIKEHLIKIQNILRKHDMELYIDYTPIGYRNIDLCVLNWYKTKGFQKDFQSLIIYDWDIYSRKPINEIYYKYLGCDAAFVDYKKLSKEWTFFNKPVNAKKTLVKWLKKNNFKVKLYQSIFAGTILSKKTLTELIHLNLADSLYYGFCEMRLPSIISSLGLNVEALRFPHFRYRPVFTKEEIGASDDNYFHPVRSLI